MHFGPETATNRTPHTKNAAAAAKVNERNGGNTRPDDVDQGLGIHYQILRVRRNKDATQKQFGAHFTDAI